jgi:hypothetical protein
MTSCVKFLDRLRLATASDERVVCGLGDQRLKGSSD